MVKDIDFDKANSACWLYSFCAERGNWFVKDGDLHFWKVYADGEYRYRIINPLDIDDFIEEYNFLNDENLTQETINH